MNRVDLWALRPQPLASFLAALGVFRIVHAQADPSVRAWWQDEHFVLETRLSDAEVLSFLCERYSPTPIVAPWNLGSGFYEGDGIAGREAIRASTDPRFADYRDTIEAILQWPELPSTDLPIEALLGSVEAEASRKKGKAQADLLALVSATRAAVATAREGLGDGDLLGKTLSELTALAKEPPYKGKLGEVIRQATKVRTKVKTEAKAAGKEALVQACRDRLGDRVVEWVDAAIVQLPRGSLAYPPILGTAGNEGRLDYSRTFMDRVADVLLSTSAAKETKDLLESALLGSHTAGLIPSPVGQFDPGRAGGFNQGPGIETKNLPTNPWIFLLAMEGVVSWSGAVSRRHCNHSRPIAVSPFTVSSSPVGYSSAAATDEEASRAEVWVPIWSRPVGFVEFRAFLAEGRAEVAGRPAATGMDFAQAVAMLGVERGVDAFVRYSLLKRRGESYVATPTGRFSVTYRREADLAREAERMLARLHNFPELPQAVASAVRQAEECLLDMARTGGPNTVVEAISALGRLEKILVRSKRVLRRPLGGLSKDWAVHALSSGLPEAKIATALASIGPAGKVGPIRANLAPVDPHAPDRWAEHGDQVAYEGPTVASRLAKVLWRRLLDSERTPGGREDRSRGTSPLRGGTAVDLSVVEAFLSENVDDRLLEDLLFGMTWLSPGSWTGIAVQRDDRSRRPCGPRLPISWCLLALCFRFDGFAEFMPCDCKPLAPEPAMIRYLMAGQVSEACKIASRRLVASGAYPRVDTVPNGEKGPRLAAALLIPSFPGWGAREIVARIVRDQRTSEGVGHV